MGIQQGNLHTKGSRFPITKTIKLFSAGILLTLLTACSATSHRPEMADSMRLETNPDFVLQQTSLRTEVQSDAGAMLLALSPAMRELVAGVDPDLAPNPRFRKLLRTLKLDDFEMEYDLGNTTSAAEAFESRRGNCISFSAMIVALAREVGLDAHFNYVEAPRSRSYTGNGGNSVVREVLHINAEVSYGWYSQVIDFNFDPKPPFPHRKISDAHTTVLYLNNLAVEAARNNEVTSGLGYLQEALELEPDSTILWTSLGYLHRLDGRLDLAGMSYSQALNLDWENTHARRNLNVLYQLSDRSALTSLDQDTENTDQET